MKWTLRQKIILISLLAVCTLIAIYVLHNSTILQAKAQASFAPTDSGLPTQNGLIIPPTPDTVPTMVPKKEASFNPADYGLPPEIGGYQIRVAVSWETRLCNPSTDLELSLYAIPNQPQTLTTADVERLEDITHRQIRLGFVSWPITISEVESQSDSFKAISCVNLGGPIFPTGDTSYDSSASGLPPQNQPIIPPTPDTSQIIMPPTALIDPADSGVLAPPTPDGPPISAPTTDPSSSYAPAYWGLPAQVGGYEIMAAISSENQACSPPNQLQLLLHAIPNQPQTLTTGDVRQLETIVNRSIQLEFSSGVVSIEQVRSHMEEWNAGMVNGCDRIGGPIIIPTPKPGDPTLVPPDDPAYWGLPEVMAGYNVLAVKVVQYSNCVSSGVVQLVLQMSGPKVGVLDKAAYDTIMSELNKLNWNVEWVLGYVEPDVSRADVLTYCVANVDRNKLR